MPKEVALAKFRLHIVQVCLTPWVNKWRLRHCLFFKDFPHIPQRNDLASEWEDMCSFRFDLTLKDLPQMSQT